MMKSAIWVAAAVACLVAVPAMAQTDIDQGAVPGLANIDIVPCRVHNFDQERADAAVRDKAFDLMKAHNLAELTRMLPDLQTALAHAPDVAPAIEHCGDKLNVYTDDIGRYLIVTAATTKQKISGVNGTVMFPILPYARIAWETGWIYYEQHDVVRALPMFEKGLLNNPHDAVVAGEYANDLEQDGQNAKALALVDQFLADNPALSKPEHAMMLRRRGYALGELGRYDDAIAAYTQSLTDMPNNAMALNEITYNKRQKALHVN